MNKPHFLSRAAALTLALAAWSAATPAQTVDAAAVARHYASVVSASYEDSLTSALDMQRAVQAFAAAPSADSLSAARKAWLAAREWYGQTEAYRFYSGPIDDAKGPEGDLNSWPLDEAYIDYVKGKPNAGLINNVKLPISKAALAKANTRGGEENVSVGWHAIEFLLWGQDFRADGPGDRSFEDYVDSKAPHADRRRQYLLAVTDLVVDDLRYLQKAWAPGARNYRAGFERGGVESLRKMIVGMGSLSRGELAGQRLETAMNTQDQEDEHSCFSDNTNRDIVNNALGIENVWLGRFKRLDGSVLQGASLSELVGKADAAVVARTSEHIAASVAAANDIHAPFDQEILVANGPAGRQRIQKTIDSLVQQSKDLADVATALGIKRLALVKPGK
jgi:putative iron-regulated protein